MSPRLLVAGLLTVAVARESPAQHYQAAQLDCARYLETARSEIETESAGRVRRALAEREGRWTFRARDTAGGIALEGWYDALAVRHGSADSLTAPDTDGLIGGRYRGLLDPGGEYRRLATPFVPDEVAEAVDATAALDELLPRLPAAVVEPGSRWSDGAGLEVERHSDSAAGRATLRRYTVHRRTVTSASVPRGDTVPVPLRQTTTDEARVIWHPTVGLAKVDRETVIEATIPAGGRIRAPVRSRVVQRARLVRLPRATACP